MKDNDKAAGPRHRRLRAALTVLAGLAASDLHAQTAPAATSGWRFDIAPYAWLPSVKGDLRFNLPPTAGGASGASIGMDTTALLEALNFAAMIAAEARRDRFVVVTDFIYLDFSNAGSRVKSVDFGPSGGTAVPNSLNTGTQSSLRGSLWTLASGYTVADGAWGHVDALAGFRLFSVSAGSDVRLAAAVDGPGPGLSFSKTARLDRDADLLDGIVGVRGRFLLGGGFQLPYGLDVGAGSSSLTWQALAGLGYQTGWAGVTLGYRHLFYDQRGDRLVQDFSFISPYLAVNFTF